MAAQSELDFDSLYGIVYKITCDVNSKVYVGQTISHRGLDMRFKDHARASYDGSTLSLYVDMRKLGIDHFKIEEIEQVPGSKIDTLDARETHHIKQLNALVPTGYNTNATGVHNCKVKQQLMKHHNLVKKYSDNYVSRQKRSKQLTAKDKSVLKDKTITMVEIRAIQDKMCPDFAIRVLVSISESRDKYRFCFKRPDLTKNIEAAFALLNEIKQENTVVKVMQRVHDLLDGKRDTYEYQDFLNELIARDDKIYDISGLISHKPDTWMYTLNFYFENRVSTKDVPKIQFGGLHSTLAEAHAKALEFLEHLKKTDLCDNSTKYRLKDVSNID
jgi:group I intron endonuclease